MPLGTKVGLGPCHIVLDRDPAPERGTAAPLFSPHVCRGHGRPSQLLLSSCFICENADYTVWGALQLLVYCQKIQDIEHLKEVLHGCLDMISQDLINAAIHQWSKHITMVIHAQGVHSEHRLN